MTKPYVIWPFDSPVAMHLDLDTADIVTKPFSYTEEVADYIIIYQSQFDRYGAIVAPSDRDVFKQRSKHGSAVVA